MTKIKVVQLRVTYFSTAQLNSMFLCEALSAHLLYSLNIQLKCVFSLFNADFNVRLDSQCI